MATERDDDEEALRQDFIREIRAGAMEYYVNNFPKDAERSYIATYSPAGQYDT